MTKQMTKSMAVSDDAHKYVRKIQNVLFNKYEIDMHMADIMLCAMKELGTEEVIADRIAGKVLENRNIGKMKKTEIFNPSMVHASLVQ